MDIRKKNFKCKNKKLIKIIYRSRARKLFMFYIMLCYAIELYKEFEDSFYL